MDRQQIKRIKADLLRHEGLRLKPYLCTAGKLTLGIGRNLEDRGISAEEADFLLDQDVDHCIGELKTNLPWFEALVPDAQEVLVNLCFNLGMTRLLGFKLMLAALESGDWEESAKQMLESKWATQVGPRAQELAQRVAGIGNQNRQLLEVLAEIKNQINVIEKRLR
ncbi:MAG: hypothetical protein A2600_06285 [Candidatus Lambdaproteobacteria bacterium RIFOXYD1_FULL_56_27]|uniref:Lysozyme n=1 Tax=Candidatus Lambdaproteobacteria bacterium RIFOXYD2_FULL_56_26 TaxID=1817773 RepID=A0A1F6GLB6_9PROT|nr:MAG: hypothetical protein A2557_12915 [Candidatus Lambdaproteobacteria bacterium RIFOXYD2_FULL_56_26]OGH05494.1 MAG: hypothetical protein A2426_03855 [Candidatus Lambdaproteobacteria bacterium RIFOXYC1_FULL_56_13]OGH09785.1 MAG: hypothetical protein A2600_06285 [Candidatus Lambdaproteobacteria bacterium RIFOXYD1_FULL_56_27]